MMGGSIVEQGYASLMIGCGTCAADCWTSRLVVVGSPWRVNSDNPSCRTFYKEPASNGNFSTIAIAFGHCQTEIPRKLHQCCSVTVSEQTRHLLTCPCYGISGLRGATPMFRAPRSRPVVCSARRQKRMTTRRREL